MIYHIQAKAIGMNTETPLLLGKPKQKDTFPVLNQLTHRQILQRKSGLGGQLHIRAGVSLVN